MVISLLGQALLAFTEGIFGELDGEENVSEVAAESWSLEPDMVSYFGF